MVSNPTAPPRGCQTRRACKTFLQMLAPPRGANFIFDLFRWFSLRFNHRLPSASPLGWCPLATIRLFALIVVKFRLSKRERPRSERAAFATCRWINLLVFLGGFSFLRGATLFRRRLLFQFVARSCEVFSEDRGVGIVVLFAEGLCLFV